MSATPRALHDACNDVTWSVAGFALQVADHGCVVCCVMWQAVVMHVECGGWSNVDHT